MQRRYLGVLAVALALTVSMMSPTLAGPPPAGWTAADIGAPEAEGSTDVTDGVWTVRGGGHDIWDAEDDFHFAYQRVTGDATISARFLSLEAVNAQWTKAGLMVRENDTAGSPYGSLLQNSGMGVRPQARLLADTDDSEQPGGSTANSTGAGPTPVPSEHYMRVQRNGNDISYYLSQDGKIWTAFGRPHTIPTLGEEALYGLAVTSHERNDLLAVGRFDNVVVTQGAPLVPGLQACAGDKLVMLEWKPLKGAESYNIYRAAAGETDASKFTLVNTAAVTGTAFTDNTAGLVNGTPVTYAVAAVVGGAEGERVLLPATPFVPTPVPGFTVLSLNENPDNANPDNVLPCLAGQVGPFFDAATGVITMRGAGDDIGSANDEAAPDELQCQGRTGDPRGPGAGRPERLPGPGREQRALVPGTGRGGRQRLRSRGPGDSRRRTQGADLAAAHPQRR
jgi:hypothetical protein